MDLQPVKSALLEAVNYDAEESVLFVQFKKNRDIYLHENISPELFEQMIQAKSVGKFYLETIKPFKERFPCSKVETADAVVVVEEQASETVEEKSAVPALAAIGEIVSPEATEELKTAALALSSRARAIEIKNPDAYSMAANTLLAIASMRAALEKQLKGTKEVPGPVRRAYDAWQAELAIFNHYDGPLAADEKRLKDGMDEFYRREEARRLAAERATRIEEEKRAEAAAKQRAEELQLADAIAAEERGEPEIAQVIMSSVPLPMAPVYVPPVSVASNVPKTKGITHVDSWTYEIVDAMKIPRKFLIPDYSALGREAKLGPRASVEGVRFFNQGGVRSSRRA